MENKAVQDALKALAAAGYKPADFQKAIKELKGQGVLKSGRGKAPSDDPTRNAIRDYILAGSITIDGKTVKIEDAITSNMGTGHSYLVTLSKKFQVNFIEKRAKVKKAKAAAATPGTPEAAKVDETFKEASVA